MHRSLLCAVMLLAPAALAQSRDVRPPVVINVDEDLIEGTVQRPSVQQVGVAPKHAHNSLIQLRKDFRAEVLASGSHL